MNICCSFVKGLQRNVGVIEENLRVQKEEVWEIIFEKIINYELLIPRMEVEEITRPMIEQKIRGRFQSIYNWFVGAEGTENEAGKLFDATNEIIRRITRYAAQLSEKNALGANRKEEYKKVANFFFVVRICQKHIKCQPWFLDLNSRIIWRVN